MSFYRRFEGNHVNSPFEIHNFACYKIREPWPKHIINPCGEIALTGWDWCWWVRPISSPFQLTSFMETYYVV